MHRLQLGFQEEEVKNEWHLHIEEILIATVKVPSTVEPPTNGHAGDQTFVHCRPLGV